MNFSVISVFKTELSLIIEHGDAYLNYKNKESIGVINSLLAMGLEDSAYSLMTYVSDDTRHRLSNFTLVT